MEADVYHTILEPSDEILHKDRKSKFYGYAFPISSEAEVKSFIETIRKKHHTANHVCYAWRLGETMFSYRANDDGEPNNSAGMPIYGQIQSFGVTNVLVAVARIFGGTKLGVGGLIQAYRTTAQMALESAEIIEKTIESYFQLRFDYAEMDKVMRTIKRRGLNILNQKLELRCELIISSRRSEATQTLKIFEEMQSVSISQKD